MIRECQVSGISRVSGGNTGLIPAPAYNHFRSEHSPSENPVVAALLGNSSTARHLQQIAPMTAGLAIQATTGLRALPIAPWAGLGVLAAWAAVALLAGGVLLGLRDA
jgi:hypothetical protein